MRQIASTDSEGEAVSLHKALYAHHIACVIGTVLRGATPGGFQDSLYQLYVQPADEQQAKRLLRDYDREA